MKIQLIEWKVTNVDFSINKDNDSKSGDNEFELSFGTMRQDDADKFGIGFELLIPDDEYTLKLEMGFLFGTESPLPEDFFSSHFVNVNAPAIAFPYVRTFVSNMTLQMGFKPLILPSINFVALAKRKEGESN